MKTVMESSAGKCKIKNKKNSTQSRKVAKTQKGLHFHRQERREQSSMTQNLNPEQTLSSVRSVKSVVKKFVLCSLRSLCLRKLRVSVSLWFNRSPFLILHF